MASIMSSQYPPLPLYGSELDNPHSDYILPYSVPPQQPSSHTSSIQNHILPYEATGSSMKANIPTANARQPLPQPQPQSHESQPSEKKRNKLGYHRTSLACGHCRRRKIRCIPSPSDSQGRCINCIRLKKECSFHPVDQQGQPEPRGKQSSQSSTGSKVGSATSSPASSHANPVEQPENPMFSLTTTHQAPAMGNSVRKSSLSHSFVPDTKGQLKISINQPYSMGDNGGGDWYLTNVPQDSDFRPEESNVASKAYIPESPMGSQFPSLAYAAPPSSAGWTSTSSEMTSQDDFTWDEFSPPTRSMSYGGEPLPNRHPMQTTLPIHHGRQYIRRPSAMAELYPSSMDVPISSLNSHLGTMAGTTVPLSAGAVPPPSFGAWNQHPQLQTHVSQSRAGDNDRGPWRYEEMDNYSPLQSNEYAPVPETNPALFYSRR